MNVLEVITKTNTTQIEYDNTSKQLNESDDDSFTPDDVEELPDGGTINYHPGGVVIYRNKKGEISRASGGPAVVDPQWGMNEWYINGQRHRSDGPAVIDANKKWWYANGIEITDTIEPFMKKYGITYPFKKDSELVTKLDADKKGILTWLLRLIKDFYDMQPVAILPFIYALKATGVKWPELDAMQRSGESELTETILNESVVDFEYQINNFIEKLTAQSDDKDRYQYYTLIDLIDNARHQQNGGATDKDLFKILTTPDVDNAIKTWLAKHLSNPSDATIEILMHTFNLLADLGIKWTSGDSNPLSGSKNIIIKHILQRISEDSGEDLKYVLEEVESLQKLGANWTELDVIKKSLNANNMQINEVKKVYGLIDIDSLTHQFLTNMVKRLEENNLRALTNTIVYLRDRGYKFDYINTALNLKKDDILKYFANNLKNEHAFYILDQMTTFRGNGIKWPECITLIKKYKNNIIKNILYEFKDENYNRVSSIMSLLKGFRINWPELDVIRKSLEVETTREYNSTLNEAEVDLSSDGLTKAALEMTKPLFDKQGFNRGLEWLISCTKITKLNYTTVDEFINEYKTLMVKYILEKMATDNLYLAKEILISLRKLNVKWAELDIIERSLRQELDEGYDGNYPDILVKLEVPMTKEYLKFDAPYGIKNMIKYGMTAKHMPEAKDLIDNKKADVIKFLLNLIKKAIDSDSMESRFRFLLTDILTFINKINEVGVDWPELDSMRRSISKFESDLNAGKPKRLAEESDPNDYIDDGLIDDAVAFLKHDVIYGIDFLNRYGLTSKHVPNAKTLIDKKKHVVIKYILKIIKKAIGDTDIRCRMALNDIQKMISNLHELGVDWPELNSTNNSIKLILTDLKETWIKRKKPSFNPDDYANLLYDLDYMLNREHKNVGDIVLYVKRLNLSIEGSNYVLSDHKDRIIKFLLTNIKNDQNSIFLDWNKHLTNLVISMTIDWPELAIIKNSLDHEFKNLTRLEEGNVNRRGLIEDVSDIEADDEDEITYAFNHLMRFNDIYEALQFIRIKFIHSGATEQFVDTLLAEHKNKIVKFILSQIMDGEILYANMLIYCLNEVKCKWPEMLTFNKSINAIMAENKLKYYNDPDDDLEEVSLNENDIDDKIEADRLANNIIHGRISNVLNDIDEINKYSNNKSFIAKELASILPFIAIFINKFMEVYNGRNIWDILEFLESLHLLQPVTEEIKKRKNHIIVFMLTAIKNTSYPEDTYEQILETINVYKWLDIDWPEFDTIEQSIKHLLNQN